MKAVDNDKQAKRLLSSPFKKFFLFKYTLSKNKKDTIYCSGLANKVDETFLKTSLFFFIEENNLRTEMITARLKDTENG